MNSTVALFGLESVAPRHPIPLNLALDSNLQALTLHRFFLDIKELGQCAIDLFNHYPLLPGLILKQAGIFFGVLSRRRFYEMMSRPSSLEFFARRPLEILCQVIDVRAWSLPAATPIVIAARQALQREHEFFYEPIAVEVPSQGVYLLDIHELLLAQATIHELTVGALQDSQQALIEEKELAQITLQSIGDGVITTDAFGQIQSLNRMAEQLTGWTHHQAQGHSLSQVFNCVDEETRQPRSQAFTALTLSEASKPIAATGLLIDRQGHERIIDYSTSSIRDAKGGVHGIVLVLRDITHQRRLARQLYWQASHDALTGLTNRTEFERLLQVSITEARQESAEHTFCYLDLDRFKIVNDTCGHLAGDELLRQISLLLQKQIRMTDALARLGGDEFGILLYNCSLRQGEAIAQGIRREMQNFRFNWDGQTFTIGVSIGLTIVDGYFDATEILRRGDMACYWAKHEGRNRVCQFQVAGAYDPHAGVAWVSRLTHALNHEGFHLYQQKVIDTTNPEKIIHSELLLRLVDEAGNLHLPGAFLSTAERYNLMPDIDRWVIQHAFKAYASALSAAGGLGSKPPSRFAINLSGASLNDDQLLEFIQAEMVTQQISPHQVCFEITETVAIANLTRASTMIHALKQMGCLFALDDFGSGMSSFTYLKTLSIDFLKIDGSFIQDITTDAVAHAMVKSIHDVAQAMGLKTIAEWVDNEPTLMTLQEIGIDYVQGYCIDQPQPLAY
ncbi:MAG TPA: EAL domain-containing protein [Trichocoleus sp.]